MYYEDLTPYSYNPQWTKEGALNVGWLGSFVPEIEKPEQMFLSNLGVLCCEPIHLMRGFHSCEICGANPMSETDHFFRRYGCYIGNGEVWVESPTGEPLVAPTMIYHYVSDHFYKPPKIFVEAVIRNGS